MNSEIQYRPLQEREYAVAIDVDYKQLRCHNRLGRNILIIHGALVWNSKVHFAREN